MSFSSKLAYMKSITLLIVPIYCSKYGVYGVNNLVCLLYLSTAPSMVYMESITLFIVPIYCSKYGVYGVNNLVYRTYLLLQVWRMWSPTRCLLYLSTAPSMVYMESITLFIVPIYCSKYGVYGVNNIVYCTYLLLQVWRMWSPTRCWRSSSSASFVHPHTYLKYK